MKARSLDILACPACRGELDFHGVAETYIHEGALTCSTCGLSYCIEHGIPHFISTDALTGRDRLFSRGYDLFSWAYRLFSAIAFTCIGVKEETGRRQLTDRLDPCNGRVLEVSIGPGVNLPCLMGRSDVAEVFGLDISLGQLRNCDRYARKKHWEVDLFLGNAERLPFMTASFGSVFHVGGINFFNNKHAAIHEMIRVAKSGAKILIADETEKGAQAYEKLLPGFKRALGGQRSSVIPPLDLIPSTMRELRLFEAWKGWLYCIEFRKP